MSINLISKSFFPSLKKKTPFSESIFSKIYILNWRRPGKKYVIFASTWCKNLGLPANSLLVGKIGVRWGPGSDFDWRVCFFYVELFAVHRAFFNNFELLNVSLSLLRCASSGATFQDRFFFFTGLSFLGSSRLKTETQIYQFIFLKNQQPHELRPVKISKKYRAARWKSSNLKPTFTSFSSLIS